MQTNTDYSALSRPELGFPPSDFRSAETLLKTCALQSAILTSAFFSSIATDEKGVIQIFNVGAERMLGYSANQVLNRLTPADLSDAAELTARAAALSYEFDVVINPGFEALVFKAARGIEDIYEITYLHRDGRRIPSIVSVTSLRDIDDSILGYLLIGTDNSVQTAARTAQALSDQKLSHEVHAHTEDLQRFRAAMDATGDGIFLTDPTTMGYLEVNATACEMLGYSREELLRLGPREIISTSLQTLKTDYQAFIRGDTKKSLSEVVLIRKDGTHLQVEVHRQAHCYQGSWTVVSVVRDNRERKRIQEEILRMNAELEDRVTQRTAQLEAANKELEAFSYSVSHDLRGPLNTIDGFSFLIERQQVEADTKTVHYIRRIRESTRQMSALIEGMLELAKMSRRPLHLSAVDLTDVCRRIEVEMREMSSDRNVLMRVQDDLLAHGDPILLWSVMHNLIGNAWKFTAKKQCAEIEIGCATDAVGMVTYFVKDNGIGFDMAYASKLFGTFERLHSPGDFIGSGIGLATVKRIISRHGGRIWAQSSAGEGAEFHFTLGSGLSLPVFASTEQIGN